MMGRNYPISFSQRVATQSLTFVDKGKIRLASIRILQPIRPGLSRRSGSLTCALAAQHRSEREMAQSSLLRAIKLFSYGMVTFGPHPRSAAKNESCLKCVATLAHRNGRPTDRSWSSLHREAT